MSHEQLQLEEEDYLSLVDARPLDINYLVSCSAEGMNYSLCLDKD